MGATVLGIAVMAVSGAPRAYLAVNAAVLVSGLLLLALLGLRRHSATQAVWLCLAAALALLATALLGTTMAGISRWMQVGPVMLQPSLVLLPAVVMAYAGHRSTVGTVAILVSALALSCQPDRAGAAALAAGLVALNIGGRDRQSGVALAASLVALAVTFVRDDPLPPVRFVEQVFADAFATSIPLGLALVAGAALLLLPARALPVPQARVFVAVWLALLLASVFGHYPTPLLGYGSSGIAGYLLCLAAFPSGLADRGPLIASRHPFPPSA